MNPELPAPQKSPEYQPVNHDVGEQLLTPETRGEQSPEREQGMKQVDRESTPPVVQPATPIAVPAPPLPTALGAAVSDDSAGPTIANDDDLIEKEWVDKAKKIIAETQNDPYLREQQVTKLQSDYLRKRYGKELGTSN